MAKASCFVAFTLLLALNLLHEARAVISGPKFPRDNGLIEPVVFELSEEEQLSDIARRARESRLHKRQSEDTGTNHIGTTFALQGDRHTHALVHWTGHPSEDVFMLTRQRDRSGYSTESWLWRSTNYGVTFENETYKFDNGSAVLEWYYISPNSDILIFTDRIHHRIYVTTDEGDTYSGHDTPFRPDSLRFQSSNAPGSQNGSLPEHVLGYDSSDSSLWVAQDLGMLGNSSWTHLGQNVTRYSWRVLDTDIEANTAVYFEQATNSTHSQLCMVESPYSSVTTFSDIGKFDRDSFVLAHEYMFVQKNMSTNGQYSSPLWVSHNRGPFKQARFPLQKQERHYSVVDASEGEVFIAVYHNFNNTNLYLSEEEGLVYSLSLEYIVSPPENQWVGGNPTFDVHVVEGIIGTYIANRRVPTSDFGATVISFDKGGEWNLLTPPAVNHDGDPVVCPPPDCSLHLHMDSDVSRGFQAILSQDSAIGLIMALGNTGPTLTSSSDAIRVYFSHDGGFTWQEVEDHFWEFEFAAQGSIVVMVPKRTDANQIKWSCNEGANFTPTNFTDVDIQVVGMFTETGERATHTTIFGYEGPGFREWLVVDLDFSTVVPNQCLPNEYYLWVPTDERPGSRCLLGEVVEYERRKPDHCCYINPTYEKPIQRTPCTCAIEDFECDFGFERVNLNSPCTPMPGIVWPPAPPTGCPENGTYNFTSGFRKVAGDKCVVGNETYFLPIVQPCPIMPPLGVFIQTDMPVIQAQVAVTFTLIQLLGARFITEYTWDFGDSTNITSIGYEQSRVQAHTYSKPGDFILTVVATNEGGEASVGLPISVLDPLADAMIVLPAISQHGSVPAGVQLIFQSNYTTEFGTDHTGNLVYVWDFGDPNDRTEPLTASATHIFVEEGQYTVELTIHSPVNSESFRDEVLVYQAADAQHVMIVSEGVEGDGYVHVGKLITFAVEKTSDAVTIPVDTVYTWEVNQGDATTMTSHDKELVYDFPTLGSYEITVVGDYGWGSFSTMKMVVAEYDIGDIQVHMKQTVCYKRTTTANVTILGFSNETYMGSLNLMVWFNGSTLPVEGTVNIDDSNKQLMLKLESSGELILTFVAANDLSSQFRDIQVNVARVSQYGSVRFLFLTSQLPEEYKSPAWQSELRNNIIDYITKHYDVEVWQVEVPPLNEVVDTSEGDTERKKREDEENFLLAADTYIVPEDLEEDNINSVLDVAMDLVNKSDDGVLYFTVDGEKVHIDGVVPIMPPLYLSIQRDMSIIQPQVEATFTLTQLLGAKFITKYTWVFGDSTSNISSIGYKQSRVQAHTYSKPGDFIVKVVATNEGGEASVELPISVLDPLADAMIVLPAISQHGSVPAGVQLIFQSNYTTEFSTDHTGDVMYTWNFGDTKNQNKPLTASATHIFVEEGQYTVELTIHSPVNNKSSNERVIVYQAADAQHVMIVSEGVEGDGYVHVDKQITFAVEKTSDAVTIPVDTVYMWEVNQGDTTTMISHDKELVYDFPTLGNYEITVVGDYGWGSFSTMKMVMAEYTIEYVQVYMKQTVCYKRTTTANVTILRVSNETYMGSLNLMVWFNGSTLPIEGTVNIDDSNKQLMLKLESSGELILTFVAANDLSSQFQDIQVNVARVSQYGSVRFLFKTNQLPEEYKSPAWQSELRNNIIDYITTQYDVEVWQVEVQVDISEGDTEHKKREDEESLFLMADTYIVPEDLEEDNINGVLDVAIDLVSKSNGGVLYFTVDGEKVQVDEGVLNPDTATGITMVDDEKTKSNMALYLGLGLGLGIGLLLVLAFAGVMVYITYRYHKKYSRLYVRYSRLQQSPVRFTFTQHGEMVEEEDDKNVDDDDNAGRIGPLETFSSMEMKNSPPS